MFARKAIFFSPSTDQQTIQDHFNDLKSRQDSQAIFDYIKSFDDFIIWVQLADRDVDIRKYCEDQQLSLHWEKYLTDARLLTRYLPYALETPLKPQPRLSNFKLLAGLYYYAQGDYLLHHEIVDVDQRQPGLGYLEKAAKIYHSFHAVLALTQIALTQLNQFLLEQREISKEFLMKILSNLIEQIPYHGAPVYEQLSYVLYSFISSAVTSIERMTHNDLCRLCLQYLYTANHLQETCQNELHNAYFGRGFSASNLLNLETLEQAIMVCEQYVLRWLKPIDLSIIYQHALIEANHFQQERDLRTQAYSIL